MYDKLLSIVIPTKNREKYLKSFLESVSEFVNDNLEVVVQDNSTEPNEIEQFLKEKEFSFVVYNYDGTNMSVVDNSNLAIKNSRGKYVCFMGDDDLVSEKLYDFVVEMDKHGYQSAIFNKAQYYWPGVEFKSHKFPNLIIKKNKYKIKKINVEKEFSKLLKKGCTDLGLMPSLYHGVILRDKLNEIYEATGTFFPGPSPDMANTVALAHYITKHVYCGLPLTTAGASPKSAAGLGTKHNHVGKISEVSFLPKGTEERWNKLVPKVWTGPTIYAQSAYEALIALGNEKALKKFNYNYLYAFFKVFCSQYEEQLEDVKKENPRYCGLFFTISRIKIFMIRVRRYLKNKIMVKTGKGATLIDNVPNTIEARRIMDKHIKSIDKLF